ncbi:g2124 [Coccomyxa elongata]
MNPEYAQIRVQVIGGSSRCFELHPGTQVAELKEVISRELRFPRDRLKLVRKGKALEDSDGPAQLQDGDSFLAVLAPPMPPKHVQETGDASNSFEESSINDPARFRLPANASPLRKRIAAFLQHRLKLPEVVLVIIFSVKPSVWLAFLAWMAAAPIASRFQVGEMYVLVTLVTLILCNLGTRREGEASAYSIFNNFRELPGQLNANVLDDQLRRGQM